MIRNFFLKPWVTILCFACAILMASPIFAVQNEYKDYETFKANLIALTSKLKSDPFDDALCIELVRLVSPRAVETNPQTADWLLKSLIGASSSSAIDVLLGIHYCRLGELQKCKMYWQLADRSSKHGSLWLNKMLVEIISSDLKDEFENESDLIALAIQSCPRRPELQLTYGVQLLNEGKMKEAYKQFESAARLAPQDTSLRRKLVEIFTEQDLLSTVSFHQDALDKIVQDFQAAKLSEAQELAQEKTLSADSIEKAKLELFKKEFAKVTADLIADPKSQAGLDKLRMLIELDLPTTTKKKSPQLDSWILQRVLAGDEQAAVSHIVLGFRQYDREEKQESDKHFEAAAIYSDKAATIIKNLRDNFQPPTRKPAGEDRLE